MSQERQSAEKTTKLLFNIPEAAEVLSLSRRSMYRLVDRNEIATVKIGASRRVPYAALVAFVERLLDVQ